MFYQPSVADLRAPLLSKATVEEDEESFPLPDGYYDDDEDGTVLSSADQELSRRLRGYRKLIIRTYAPTWQARLPTVLMYIVYLFV